MSIGPYEYCPACHRVIHKWRNHELEHDKLKEPVLTQSLEVTEQLGGAGAVAPRITLDFIKGQIASTHYVRGSRAVNAADRSDWIDKRLPPNMEVLTVCLMVLKSGYIVIGKSAPLSPDNFDAGKGQTFAYEDCVRQLWPMFAFGALQMRTGQMGA